MVHEVVLKEERQEQKTYALKQYFLDSDEATQCAQRELRILKRIASEHSKSPFITDLLCSFFASGSLVLVLTKGQQFNLFSLLSFCRAIPESNAKFYSCEILSGLGYLHAMGVMHLNLEPRNILFTDSGHLLISNFSCAYDTNHKRGPPQEEDYRGDKYYMAPEVASRTSISSKSDVWSFGALMAKMARLLIEFDKRFALTKSSSWKIENFDKLPKLQQHLIIACLQSRPRHRPSVIEIKRFPYFCDVNWNSVVSLSQLPPKHRSRIISKYGPLPSNLGNHLESLSAPEFSPSLNFLS